MSEIERHPKFGTRRSFDLSVRLMRFKAKNKLFKQKEKGLTLLRDMIAFAKQTLGVFDERSIEWQWEYGDALFKEGKPKESEGVYLEIVDNLSEIFSAENEEALKARHTLIKKLIQEKKIGKAVGLCESTVHLILDEGKADEKRLREVEQMKAFLESTMHSKEELREIERKYEAAKNRLREGSGVRREGV